MSDVDQMMLVPCLGIALFWVLLVVTHFTDPRGGDYYWIKRYLAVVVRVVSFVIGAFGALWYYKNYL